MRKSLLFVWACMGLVCLVSACKTSVKSKEWKLVWVENFDQKNSFDESVWTKIDRKSTRLNSKSRQYLVCRLLLEKKKEWSWRRGGWEGEGWGGVAVGGGIW